MPVDLFQVDNFQPASTPVLGESYTAEAEQKDGLGTNSSVQKKAIWKSFYSVWMQKSPLETLSFDLSKHLVKQC